MGAVVRAAHNREDCQKDMFPREYGDMKQKRYTLGLGACAALVGLLFTLSAIDLLWSRPLHDNGDEVRMSGLALQANTEANTWTNLNPTHKPSARWGHAMAYDSKSDRVVLFGGGPGGTWVYDFDANTWTDMNPPLAPTVKTGHAMAYDSKSDRVVLFGGDDGLVDRGDTWAYDVKTNTWTNMNPARAPMGRRSHVLTYDAQSDKAILFAGCLWPCKGISDLNNETWAYDFDANTWTDMNPPLAPSNRWISAMVYDSQSHRFILFGGSLGGGVISDETWAYRYR